MNERPYSMTHIATSAITLADLYDKALRSIITLSIVRPEMKEAGDIAQKSLDEGLKLMLDKLKHGR